VLIVELSLAGGRDHSVACPLHGLQMLEKEERRG
jgi:hypothetical protein